MPVLPAQETNRQSVPIPVSPQEIMTWEKLPPSVKNDFFANIANKSLLKELLEQCERMYGLHLTFDFITFQQELETSIEEKEIQQQEHQQAHHSNHGNSHGNHTGHQERKVDMLHDGIKNNDIYRKALIKLREEKRKKWKKKEKKISATWEKKNKKSIDLPEGQQYLARHAANPHSYATEKQAEAIFRNRKENKELIKRLDQEALHNTSKRYEEDFIGKQFQNFAAEAIRHDVRKLKKAYKKGKITKEEYQKKATERYQKNHDHQAEEYVSRYHAKAYIQKKDSQILQKAWAKVQPGKVRKYEKRKMAIYRLAQGIKKTLNKNPFSKKNKKTSQTKSDPLSVQNEEYKQLPDAQEFTPKEAEYTQRRYKPVQKLDPNVVIQAGISDQDIYGIPPQQIQTYEQPQRENPYTSQIQRVHNILKIIKRVKKIGELGEKIGELAEGAAVLLNPYVLAGIGIALLIIILILIVVGIVQQSQNNANQNQTDPPIAGLTITLKAITTTVTNGDNQIARYEADVTCDTTCQQQEPLNIYIDTLPQGTTPVNPTTDTGKNDTQYTTTPYPMTWNMLVKTPKATIIFALNTAAKIDNTKIALTVKGAVAGGGVTAGGAKSTVPPSQNTCGTKYINDIQKNTLKANYGDPTCDFTEPKLADTITQLDAANKYKWYNVIAWCESHYNPNAFAPPVGIQATLDASGAWGLFQMGTGKNGDYDHGDVYWKDQTTNAITYNKLVIGGNFAYWATRNYNPKTCKPY